MGSEMCIRDRSEHNVESANRWLRGRLWNAVLAHVELGPVSDLDINGLSEEQRDIRRLTHEALSKAADDYGRRLNFNTVVSGVMSLLNQLAKFEDASDAGRVVRQEAFKVAVLVMSPITPHVCRELWSKLELGAIEEATWPEVDESALAKRVVQLMIQVNGKLRGKLEMAPDASEDDVVREARKIKNVEKFLDGKETRKVIHVSGKLLNFVVS